MQVLCTIVINKGNSLGSIITTGNYVYVCDDYSGDIINLCKIDQVSVDPVLRELSKSPYIITTDNKIMYNDTIYQTSKALPSKCQYMAIPIIGSKDMIVEYNPISSIDSLFINERYVRELCDAEFILIPPSLKEYMNGSVKSYTAADLLIDFIDKDNIANSKSGRQCVIPSHNHVDDRYLFLDKDPVFTGIHREMPRSYTLESLSQKYTEINMKLQEYGLSKTRSINETLRAIIGRIDTYPNKFRIFNLYDEIVNLSTKVKTLTQ